MTTFTTPWTEEQCARLNEWQNCGWVHPFTCKGQRSDRPHADYARAHNQDLGQLVATPQGWVCPVCGYRQSWAHVFMFEGPPPRPLPREERS
jgi:hypothetical protein